jgi:ribosomal protein S19
MLNKKLCIYNGYRFVVMNISTKLKGFRLGEFSVTRRRPRHKGKKRQKKIKEKIMLNLLQQKKLKEKNNKYK